MKRTILTACAALSVFAATSCSDSSSENFNNSNGDTAKKYIKKIEANSSEGDHVVLSVNYDTAGKVISATDGEETSYFAYNNGDLTNISGSSDVLSVADVINGPHDAYEAGDVLNYDASGNPVKVRLYSRDWDGSIYETNTAEITYDAKPNPYFYTLEAAGIIKVLDQTDLNFSMAPAAPQLIKAKMLLPVNNPKKVVIKNEQGTVVKTVLADYVYDGDNYPTSGTVTENDENGTFIYTATYTYK